jgi:hypothetical protein
MVCFSINSTPMQASGIFPSLRSSWTPGKFCTDAAEAGLNGGRPCVVEDRALSRSQRTDSFHAVKFLPLLAIVFLTGCQTRYTKFTVTDYQGGPIATWVAEGGYSCHEQGYRIRAVERHSGPPYEVHNRYPNGWRAVVTGPNIVRESVAKPEWLRELDGE